MALLLTLWKHKNLVASGLLMIFIVYLLSVNNAAKLKIDALSEEVGKQEVLLEIYDATVKDLNESIRIQNLAVEEYKKKSMDLSQKVKDVETQNATKDKALHEYITRFKTKQTIPDGAKEQIGWLRDRAIEFSSEMENSTK